MVDLLRRSLSCLLAVLAACDRSPPRIHDASNRPQAVQTGLASFYGREFDGRKTASGETFRVGALTAASPTLPLGARVKVVNLDTGRSTHVRINDRGPYAKGRVIDLTPTAARHIGMGEDDGVAPVGIAPVSLPAQATQ